MGDEALELETRKKIYETVKKFPGLHLRELARQLGLSVPLVDYHLNFLEKYGIVTGISDEQYRRFYPKDPIGAVEKTDVLSSDEKRIVALLRQRIPLQIVLFIMKKGSAQHKEMVPVMGISPSTLSHHLNKLQRRGVLLKTSAGEDKGYRLANEGQMARLMLHYEPPPGTLVDSFVELWEEFHQ